MAFLVVDPTGMEAKRRPLGYAHPVLWDQGGYEGAGGKAVSVDDDPFARVADGGEPQKVLAQRATHVVLNAGLRRGRVRESN
jgi:hypothetical protein